MAYQSSKYLVENNLYPEKGHSRILLCIEFVWSNWPPSPNNVLMSQITSAVDRFRRQNFFLIFQKTWKQTKIWLYQIDTLLCSNKVRNFGEPGPSAKKMVIEYIVLWSNWPPSPRIGLRKIWPVFIFPQLSCFARYQKFFENLHFDGKNPKMVTF